MTADRQRGLVQLRAGAATATIDPASGGILLSATIDGDELLLPPFDHSGPVPRHGSFVLAPWVGELAHGRLMFRGRGYRLPVTDAGPHALHGLVFGVPWTVTEHTGSALTLRRDLTSPWPFGGWVTQRFELDAGGLTQTVAAHAEAEPMPVAIGWHPWFRVPSGGDCSIVVDATHVLELQPDLLPTGRVLPVTGEGDLRAGRLVDGRHLDTVLLGARSPALLRRPAHDIEISFDTALSIVTVYTGPGFVCLEPWSSWPNAADWAERGTETTGRLTLDPGESVSRWMRWSW